MANLTITVDEDTLRKARVRAIETKTSVNAVLREYLEAFAGGTEDRATAMKALIEQSRASRSARGKRRWTRDDLHER